MAKQKVSELPKEEQDALLSEAKEAGLRMGLVQGWTVETLKKRIEEAKANKQPENENKADGEAPVTEESTEGDEGEDEALEDEKTEDGEENGDDETPKEEEATEDEGKKPEETPLTETPSMPKQQTKKVEVKKEPAEEKVYICHICRSKFINGKCTGCGFSVGG